MVRSYCFLKVINSGPNSKLKEHSRIFLSQTIVYKLQIVMLDCKLILGHLVYSPAEESAHSSCCRQVEWIFPPKGEGRLHICTECLALGRFTISISYYLCLYHIFLQYQGYCEVFLPCLLSPDTAGPQLLVDFSLGGVLLVEGYWQIHIHIICS